MSRFLWLLLVGLVTTSPLSAQDLKLRHSLACQAEHLRFSPDGKTLASLNPPSGELKLWDVATGKSIATPAWGEHKVSSVSFTADGQALALRAAVKDHFMVEVWGLASGKKTATLDGHGDGIGIVAFSPSGKIVATGGEHGKINVWDVATAKIVATYKEDAAVWFSSLAFSPDGKYLASVAGDSEVELWELSTGKGAVIYHEQARQGDALSGVAFSPDSKIVAVAGSLLRQWIHLWSVATGKKTLTLPGHKPCGVESFVFRPDGTTIISVGLAGEVKIWDAVTGENIATLALGEDLTQNSSERTLSPDGKTLALLMDNGKTIKLFEVKVDKEVRK